MKKYLIFLLLTSACTSSVENIREELSLAGDWKFKIDSLDNGFTEEWNNNQFDETVILPGSMTENGKGDEVTLETPWTGDIIDMSYFTDDKYEKYRQPGNIKIPFWLKPVKYYKGAAWYSKDVEIPDQWSGERVVLHMERCHWESTLYVNGEPAGTRNSLSTPHEYDLTGLLTRGKNRIMVRIDNRVIIPVGVNSHSISDHTQSNWNGITGRIALVATPKVYIDDIKIFPDVKEKKARVVVTVLNSDSTPFTGTLILLAESFNSSKSRKLKARGSKINLVSDRTEMIIDYPMGSNPEEWSEFNPALYRISVKIIDSNGNLYDTRSSEFGMRNFKASGTRFEINGHPVFLRGTLECCIFPMTGYPPCDELSWIKILTTFKDYGLNHVRFHSWCPPEAAFKAADKLGIYLMIECSSWPNQGSTIGNGGMIDKYIYDEGDRILKEYGNHPSFCMLASGNEPSGRNHREYLTRLISYWKSTDDRRVYTSAAGWPIIPANDFNVPSDPRIQHWGEELNSIINREAPQTLFDYREFVSKYSVPTVSHEIGQWCAYPDFKEIAKYSGVLKPTNFEIFRESLNENNMGDQAEDFLMASGKLQALCYKADIEAALRTPGFGGFQLLQLHDFPGQGTALVGVLNPFFESKGYIRPEEFRMFCNETVPLARMQKLIYKNNESFRADIEIAHFGQKPLVNPTILCKILDQANSVIFSETIKIESADIGNCIPAGSVKFDLSDISRAQKLVFEVAVENTSFRNCWDFWVYPSELKTESGKVLITESLDKKTEEVLKEGGRVLLLTFGKVAEKSGAQVGIGFSSIFWNTAWTRNQAPHTLGILCDPQHPLFTSFPTEYHSNWQWWEPVSHSQAMILDDFPSGLKPLIQPVDTWFENRKLALAFEVKAGNGKIMVCSIEMDKDIENRAVTKQLLSSMLSYMNSDSFNPVTEVDLIKIKSLLTQK